MPTELTKDYQQFYVLNEEQINNDPVFSTIKEDLTYRSGALFEAELLTKDFFKEAVRIKEIKKIIISGIKINDYDVELIEIFSYIQSRLIKAGHKLEEIVIINPDNHDADRANILLAGISRRVIQKFETTRIIYEE